MRHAHLLSFVLLASWLLAVAGHASVPSLTRAERTDSALPATASGATMRLHARDAGAASRVRWRLASAARKLYVEGDANAEAGTGPAVTGPASASEPVPASATEGSGPGAMPPPVIPASPQPRSQLSQTVLPPSPASTNDAATAEEAGVSLRALREASGLPHDDVEPSLPPGYQLHRLRRTGQGGEGAESAADPM